MASRCESYVNLEGLKTGRAADFKRRFSGGSLSTRRLRSTGGQRSETTARWNATKGSTLQRLFGSRKIVHSHWSYIKPKLSASPDAHEGDVRAIRESEIAWDGAWQRGISNGPLITMPTMRPREGAAYPPRAT